MTKKITIIVLALLVLIPFNFLLESAPRNSRTMRHARYGIFMAEKNLFNARILLRVKEDIGLTDEQVKKIEKMRDLFSEAVIRREADIKVETMKFKTFLKADKINRSKMEQMIRNVAKLKTESQLDRFNYMLDLRDVLTKEQMAKMDELKKKRRSKWMKNRRSGKRGRFTQHKRIKE